MRIHKRFFSGIRTTLQPFVICLVLISCKSSAVRHNFDTLLEITITNKQEVLQLKGIAVSVILPDGSEWSTTAGYSHEDIEINENMLFNIGSVTKNFVAVTLLKQIEKGLLTLNDSIGSFLDISNQNVDPSITVNQLLNHTSGIFNYLKTN